jgi:hypothetical protein
MYYLPLQCILRTSLMNPLSKRMEEVILLRSLSKAAWSLQGRPRVLILPTQSFALDAFKWEVHVRQHLMPHNSELATTIQTTCYNDMGRMCVFESLTYLTTACNVLYQASYLLQEASKTSYAILLTEPRTIKWHRLHLLEDAIPENR